MGTTEYNVRMIQRRLPKESPEFIVQVLNEVQNYICSQDSYQLEKITSTGLPPYIATTQGVYEYDCPADCRRTIAVFTQDYPRLFNRQRQVGPKREYYFRNKGYYKLNISTRDATEETVAKIYFQEDPGTTTNKYFHHYYVKPVDISDMSIQLTLPPHVHFMLRDAVVSLLTSDEYGKSGYDDQIFSKVTKKIRAELNKGEGGCVGFTPIQEVMQEQHFGSYGYGDR